MLACLKETLFFPSFATNQVEKLRQDLLNEVRSLPENNLEYIKQEFYDRVFAGHPYGHPTVGTEESLTALTADDLESFHDRVWTPAHTVVVIVGDVDPAEVAEWIAGRWADLDATPSAPWTVTREPLADWQPPSATQVLDLGKDYWTVNWGRPGCAFDDDRYFPSVVLARMAGNDHFYKYVYGEGVSYRSWINLWPNLGASAWILENDVKRDRFDEILAMFDEDLVRYSTQGFPQQELDDAITRLGNTHVLRGQDNALTAWRLAVAEGNGVGFRRYTDEVAALRAVQLDDVQALAREVFAPEGIFRLVQQ
jgi:zinc protease